MLKQVYDIFLQQHMSIRNIKENDIKKSDDSFSFKFFFPK